ncbi:DUF2382 domain-containing protein [Kitasatospora sp. NPDC094015]|uniref:YsnF/AvaK domain-containing protein n=1 Tax=Kitasatospora sp. NPDC094015 TaxID=3155205 RepID=UPI003321F74E
MDFGKVSSGPATMAPPESSTSSTSSTSSASSNLSAPPSFGSGPPTAVPMAVPMSAPAEAPTVHGSPMATALHTAPPRSAPDTRMPEEKQPEQKRPEQLRPEQGRPEQERPTTAAPSSPGDPVEVTCREERLDITTEWHVLGTARLRKYVTSEPVERKVPVVRERVRVERVPVTDAERAALTEQEIAEGVEEVTLREERPVVRKYLAPIERVRLVVERYTEEAVVREELRREQVEIHDSTAPAAADTPPTGQAQRSAPASGSMPDAHRPEPLRPS